MYSYEIENLLKTKNYLLEREEYFNLFNTSPQIRGVEYKPNEDNFYIWTDDKYTFKFKVKSLNKENNK